MPLAPAPVSCRRPFTRRLALTAARSPRDNENGVGWLSTVVGEVVITETADFTVPEKILLAADHLEKDGQSPFSAEALIVASWQKFPKTFGLKGYADQYPDSNKVLSQHHGREGPGAARLARQDGAEALRPDARRPARSSAA